MNNEDFALLNNNIVVIAHNCKRGAEKNEKEIVANERYLVFKVPI
jgi:hypothetical protein